MNEKLMAALISAAMSSSENSDNEPLTSGNSTYVVVRCRDAGVHAGELVNYHGREATLRNSRRLWYWKPANGAAWLSGVASQGLDTESKVGTPVTITLTETCEILYCTPQAEKSISSAPDYVPEK